MDEKSATALLLIDAINAFDFDGGSQLLKRARSIAPGIQRLKARARAAGVPVIYVNDHFGQWRANFSQLVEHCLQRGGGVRSFVEMIRPSEDDYLVLKPKHSAFYQTPLDLLLRHLGIRKLILTGLATNSCILCTANDAHMRDLNLAVPRDGCAAETAARHNNALKHMETMLQADLSPVAKLRFR